MNMLFDEPQLQKVEMALFPIPDMVVFPGNTVPLHVFEPRYRNMINDCVSDQRLLAISHTKKKISDGNQSHDMEDTLAKNQASYEACKVFSAGQCELIETTQDGRMYVEVHAQERYRLLKKIQEVPYQIIHCEQLKDIDNEPESSGQENRHLQTQINQLLGQICIQQSPKLYELLAQPEWREMEPAQFSFDFFRFVRFESDLMQEILENISITQRLKMILNRLSADQSSLS